MKIVATIIYSSNIINIDRTIIIPMAKRYSELMTIPNIPFNSPHIITIGAIATTFSEKKSYIFSDFFYFSFLIFKELLQNRTRIIIKERERLSIDFLILLLCNIEIFPLIVGTVRICHSGLDPESYIINKILNQVQDDNWIDRITITL